MHKTSKSDSEVVESTEDYLITRGSSSEELRELLSKYNQEAALCITPEGEISFDYLEERNRHRLAKNQVGRNVSKINGIDVTFQTGDEVWTKDGRKGIVLGSFWAEDLVLYRYESEPRKGYYVILVDFEDHIERHIRNDLIGARFRRL
jgi:hypothetical protein